MFGWFKKEEKKNDNSIVFDLTPIVNKLSRTQKLKLDPLADLIFSEIHRAAFAERNYRSILEGWIFFRFELELLYGSLLKMKLSPFYPYTGDPKNIEATKYYEEYKNHSRDRLFSEFTSFFPINKMQSVYKLAPYVMPGYENIMNSVGSNKGEKEDLLILNLISMEIAVNIILGTRVDPSTYCEKHSVV